MSAARPVFLVVELSPDEAAGLKRFADKVTHASAMEVLYPHVKRDIRDEQAYNIMNAFRSIEKALQTQHVRDWPWIETGSAK